MPADELRPAGEVGVEALVAPVVEREDVVLPGLDEEQALQLAQLLGLLVGEVVRLRPVVGAVELPDVVVEGGHLGGHPRDAVPRHRGPALVVDPAVAEHLEVLRRPPVLGARVVERVRHRDAVQRLLLDAVDAQRLGELRGVEHRRGDVDHVVELRADLASRLDAARPVHDRPVARAAPVRRDLLRPLVRRVHRVRPADRVVVVGVRRAEVVDPGDHELGRLEPERAVQDDELVEAAVRRAFGRGAVVADDVVDERVLEDLELAQRVDQPADVVVGVLEEAGVDLHLAREHGLQVVGHVVPGGDLLGRSVSSASAGITPSSFWRANVRSRSASQPSSNCALVLVRPLRPHVMRSVRGAGREVDEERLVRHQRLLLLDPVDRLVGHVLGEVVALLRRLLLLDRAPCRGRSRARTGSSRRR